MVSSKIQIVLEQHVYPRLTLNSQKYVSSILPCIGVTYMATVASFTKHFLLGDCVRVFHGSVRLLIHLSPKSVASYHSYSSEAPLPCLMVLASNAALFFLDF